MKRQLSFNILMRNKTLNHAEQNIEWSGINAQLHRNITKIDEEESYLAIAHSDEKVGITMVQCWI